MKDARHLPAPAPRHSHCRLPIAERLAGPTGGAAFRALVAVTDPEPVPPHFSRRLLRADGPLAATTGGAFRALVAAIAALDPSHSHPRPLPTPWPLAVAAGVHP
jgi:hypothetical protein